MRLVPILDQLNQHSYYAATAHAPLNLPQFQGVQRADICVVGGGLAGLSAALELSKKGLRVTVLEAQTVGWGASGRNGGQALAGFASDQAVYESQLGMDLARQAWDISVEGIDLLRQRIAQYQIDCDWVDGAFSVAVTDKKARDLFHGMERMQTLYRYPHLKSFDKSAIRQAITSNRYQAGVLDTHGGHLHPLNYTLGLARAAMSEGASLFERSEVTAIKPGALNRKAVVKTSNGEVHCNFVVLTGNVNLGDLSPPIKNRIMPVGTYVIATNPLSPDRAKALIPNREAVCDTQFVLDYYRLAKDHRMIFGGRVSYSTRTPRNLAETMRQKMLRVFPQLADVAVTHAWGGFVDISMNRAPDFGRVASDIYYLQGFSGHGLALTGIAGKLAAEAISGQAERFDLLAKIKHQEFPGGDTFRTPALILGTLYYRLRDYI